MNNQLYNDYTIFASISTDSMYYQYLSDCFGKENIYILNLSKANLMTFFVESLDKTKNNKIIFIPPSNKTFDINLVKKLKTHWDDEKLIIFNNKTPLKPVKHNIIGFNKNKININMLKKMKYNIIIQYLFNLYGSNIKKILLQDKEKIPKSKEEKIIEKEKTGISIIIPAYNADLFIEECLDSIINQTYFKNNNNYEILLGIDHCQKTLDKVREIRYKYKNLYVYMMDSNEGPYITKNTLISLSSSDNLLFFDSDDVMKDDMIENIFQNTDKFDMIRFSTLNFEEDISKSTEGKYCHGCFFIKRKQFNKLGGFKPWRCAADTDFLRRIGYDQKNQKLFNITYILNSFYRRIHPQSLIKHEKTSHISSLRNTYRSHPYHIGECITPVTNTYQTDESGIFIKKRDIFEYTSIKDNKLIRTNPGYKRIEVRNDIIMNKYKPCLCMCLYSRPENLETILSALENQTYKNFEFFIWNNKPEIKQLVDGVIEKYKNLDINIFHSEKNQGSYARLLIPQMTKNNPIIYFDDDRIPQKDFVEYCLKRYIKFPFAIQGSWAFKMRNEYWKRTKVKAPDIEVDYCGTGGMVLDRSLFDDNRVIDIPEKWKNIEDLWLNFIARKYHNKPLISMENKLTILKDDKDQYKGLLTKKTDLFNYIRDKGYTLVSDIIKSPKISIIIVTYNRWELTKKCIDSVIENTPLGTYELIIVDNKSTDETIENLQKLKQENKIHKLILNNENLQLGGGFNTGYKNCSKDVDYVMTLNNDHFVMNGWYYNVLAAFKNNDIDFVASTIRGASFHIKNEVIDKDTNCRFLIIDGNLISNNKSDFVKSVIKGDEIGEGLIFKSEYIFKNKIKWSNDFPNAKWKGSYHARMAEYYLKPLKMKGVELGRPCTLWQKSGMKEYNKYYCDLFNSRRKKIPKKDYQFDVIQDKCEYYKWTDYLKES